MRPFKDPAVEAAYEAFPPQARDKLLEMRELVLRSAGETQGVGAITECLKWGEPSYLPVKSGIGTTVRMAWKEKLPDHVSVFLHCQSGVVGQIRDIYPDTFIFEGNRQLSVPIDKPLPEEELMHCFSMALTYHLRKKADTQSK